MSKVNPDGWRFSVRHADDYTSVKKTTTEAENAYVDDNAETIIIEGGDGDSAATIILNRSAAERLNEKLSEVLQ